MAGNTGQIDQSRQESMPGMDQIIQASRVRATLANPLGVNWISGFGTPVSTTPGAASTITAANLLTGFVIQAPSAGNTSTLDSAANIVAAVNGVSAGAVIGDIIPCYLGNGSAANGITVAAGSGGGFDANQPVGARAIAVNSSRYIFIRLTNVTGGTEAYTVYL